jgi:hypothetical protein
MSSWNSRSQIYLIVDATSILHESFNLPEALALYHSDPNAVALIARDGVTLLSRSLEVTVQPWDGNIQEW